MQGSVSSVWSCSSGVAVAVHSAFESELCSAICSGVFLFGVLVCLESVLGLGRSSELGALVEILR